MARKAARVAPREAPGEGPRRRRDLGAPHTGQVAEQELTQSWTEWSRELSCPTAHYFRRLRLRLRLDRLRLVSQSSLIFRDPSKQMSFRLVQP